MPPDVSPCGSSVPTRTPRSCRADRACRRAVAAASGFEALPAAAAAAAAASAPTCRTVSGWRRNASLAAPAPPLLLPQAWRRQPGTFYRYFPRVQPPVAAGRTGSQKKPRTPQTAAATPRTTSIGVAVGITAIAVEGPRKALERCLTARPPTTTKLATPSVG